MPSLPVALLLLVASAGAIYLACEYFVNGVEWAGRKASFGQQATGTVLAAFGTALPESVVTLVAVLRGGAEQKQIGIGAALGGPLALATLAYAVVGICLLVRRRTFEQTGANRNWFRTLAGDQAWFLVIFACKLALGVVAFAAKPWLGFAFLAAYAVYCWREVKGGGGSDEEEGELERLKIAPHAAVPGAALVAIQVAMSLIVIFVASRVFVGQLDALGPHLGLRPQVLALLLAPIATELPETLNAVIWVRQGKTRLALANISGAMMIQATVPTAFGLFFTPWLLQPALLLAGGVTAATILTMYVAFSRGWVSRTFLALVPLFYVAFIVAVLAFRLE